MEKNSQPWALSHLKQNQMKVFLCPARFRVLVAGRRFGKTYLALAEIMRAALRPNSLVWYVGPNDRQSKRIVWDRLKALTRPNCASISPPAPPSLSTALSSPTLCAAMASISSSSMNAPP
jgi:hypothetical protein